MKLNILTLLLAGMIVAVPENGAASHMPPGSHEPLFTKPREVVGTFLRAVRRGELRVFDHGLRQSMITPVHVEYVFGIDDPIPVIRVFSHLNHALPVPGCGTCSVEGVTVELSLDGHIVDVEVHIAAE